MSEPPVIGSEDRDRFVSVVKLLGVVLLAVCVSGIAGALAVIALDETWVIVTASLALYAVVGLATQALLSNRDLDWRRFVGGYPTRSVRVSMVAGLGAAALTYGCIWLVYLPLSYVLPAYTLNWLTTSSAELLLVVNGELVFWQNLFLVLAVIVVAPVVEEFIFRGVLLHRLAERYGRVAAVMTSSILFGLVHPEVLGHILFGIVAALLYLRTGSLWAPIILHVTNNALALSFEFIAVQGVQEAITLEGFRNEWLYGLLGLMLGVPWFVWMCRLTWPATRWALPYDRNTAPIGPVIA